MLGLTLIIIWDGFLQGFDQAIHGNSVRLYSGNIQVHALGFRDKASRLPLIPLDDTDEVVQVVQGIQEVMALENAFLGVFSLIVLLIASIGILNLMLMVVFERTREIGVLQALGMKGRQLMGLFVMEGMMVGAVGAVIGCILGWLLILLLSQVGIDMSSYGEGYSEFTALMGERICPAAHLSSVIGYGIGVVLIAGLASLIPARQASRNEPSETLHHV